MGKSKKPRRPKSPPPDQNPSEEEPERPTQTKGELAPVRLPQPLPTPRSAATDQPVLVELIQTIRNVVGTMLDIADAAAEAITKRLEGRA